MLSMETLFAQKTTMDPGESAVSAGIADNAGNAKITDFRTRWVFSVPGALGDPGVSFVKAEYNSSAPW
jgi:hypothetical protein